MSAERKLRKQVAELTETVGELRDEVAALRDSQHGNCCSGCHCWHGHVHWYPTGGAAGYWPYTYTVGSTTSTAGYVHNWNAAGAAGASPTYTITN